MKTIIITYSGELDKILDDLIVKVMKNAGFEWYAQGYDLVKKERNICFDVKEEILENS